MRVVVVGAGLAGLSAACHLRGDGHDVTVLEAGGQPGGRAGMWEVAGYRLDTGPTVLTMPDLLAAVFASVGQRLEDYVTLIRLDPAYRACFADGSEIRVRSGRAAMTAEIAALCNERDAAAFEGFCDWLAGLYRLEFPHFIDRNFDSPLDLARDMGAVMGLLRAGGFGKLQHRVEATFQDPRLHRLFAFQALYAGLSPFEALALYGVITYMDTVAGVYTAQGGMHAVPVALAAAATRAGVTFRYGAEVVRVARDATGAVSGVQLADGERVVADAVVVTVDLPVAFRELLGSKPPLVARRGRYSPSCVVWLAGVRGELPVGVEHHNIHFGHAWKGAFKELLSQGRRMTDPSLLVTAASCSDATLSPAGCHSLFVLEPVPNLDGRVDWTKERARLEADLVPRLQRYGYPSDIEVSRLTDPLDWQRQGMERGTPFALAHLFRQTGPFRPANHTAAVPGLVFAGSGTVPGVGIPMVLVSGRLAAQRVAQYERTTVSERRS